MIDKGWRYNRALVWGSRSADRKAHRLAIIGPSSQRAQAAAQPREPHSESCQPGASLKGQGRCPRPVGG